MPLAKKPECTECKCTNSELWRKTSEEDVVCNECYLKETHPEKLRSNGEGSSKSGSTFIGTVRKSARIKPSKYRNQVAPKPLATKGKSRRVVFKKNVRVIVNFANFDSCQYENVKALGLLCSQDY